MSRSSSGSSLLITSLSQLNVFDEEIKEIKRLKFNGVYGSAFENIKLLATLVPDEIIYLSVYDDSPIRQHPYTGVLFFADVSGFTDLCEKFNSLGKGGPSRITEVLNEYIGAMVQEIMSHNGDILKFSGDAFLALFKNQNDTSMTDVVHAAIDCALGIQRSHGQYETEVGIILRVKIAIAAGQIIMTVIEDCNYMVLGNTTFEVKDVGNMCNAGDIIIAQSVKMFIMPNYYIFENVPGNEFIKIIGLGPSWAPSRLSQQYDIFDVLPSDGGGVINNPDNEDSETSFDLADSNIYAYFALRPSIEFAIQMNLETYLRKYIIGPVVRAIDLGEPLENLTEMRNVVIVFINIITKALKLKQLKELICYIYRTVSEMVSAIGGCVNKVSMFDKDLMFLVIFGLRGFKHNLEAQRALYCAKKIRDKLIRINHIMSASVGVTTGATYCGVVGHPMRKEYTVIGRTVNKAARLMIAYPDIVTCDRQTFLASQLQSRYFTLLPTRYLKGFKNVGPIYQFDDECSEEDLIAKEMMKTNQYPILDRQKEMEIFLHLLDYKANNSAISLINEQFTENLEYNSDYEDFEVEYSMLIVKGEARQGKTRLLNEIGFRVKDEIPHYKCVFDANTTKYKIFRRIFGEGCKIVNVKDVHMRTKHVWRVLSPFKVPEFLCALNEIMLVEFDISKPYLRLTEDEKLFVKKKMVKYLCKKIFREISLITIDNIEYMDDESWILYQEIINAGSSFTCATLGSHSKLCDESKDIMESDQVKTIELGPIHEWYQAALICQFLNVRGVSLELEKYIQTNSFGNPGWIESFLTTLSHSNILKILELERKFAYDQGFVLPAKALLQRQKLKLSLKRSILNFLENKSKSFLSLFDISIEGWDIYKQTIAETNTERMHSELVTVCNLPSNISLEEIDTDEYLNVQMLITYDSLNVQEQHLLKCSSILGETFRRCKLEYVMQSYNRAIAIAIQKLFEIHVFGCARGVYKNGAITVDHYMSDPNKDLVVKCDCVGFPKNPFYRDLPDYASCGYIRFCSTEFRNMCTTLLTDTQANLYHIRAIWFLENETTRCLYCGLGYFTNINGQNNDDGMKKYSIEEIPNKTAYVENLHKDEVETESLIKSIDEINKSDNLFLSLYTTVGIDFYIPEDERMSTQARTFLENNLSNCDCTQILISMYTQVIEHNEEGGKFETLMYSLLEYAELCIRNNNDAVAFTIISKAKQLLPTKYVCSDPEWKVPLITGKISALAGHLNIKRRSYLDAERDLLEALASYNLKFPQSKLAVKAAINYRKFQQKIIFKYFPEVYRGSCNEHEKQLAEQTAEALNMLHTVYIETFNHDKAYLASLWGLTEALRCDSNFQINCIAYRNALRMDTLYNRPKIIKEIEIMALEMCYRKYIRLELHEFEAVIKMYSAIFCRHCFCENIRGAIRLGCIVINVNTGNFGGIYSWRVTPIFLRLLTFTYQVKQAAKLILAMLEISNQLALKNLHYNPMRIHVLCTDFMTYTTYSLLPISVCHSSFTINMAMRNRNTLTLLHMKYFIGLWLWYLRKRKWQLSVNIYNYVSNPGQWPYMEDSFMCYTNFNLLEGLILLWVRKINIHDITRAVTLSKFIKVFLKKVNKITARLKAARSRYYILLAYYNMVLNKKKKAYELLLLAEIYAKKSSNLYEIDWIEHNRKAWDVWPEGADNDEWIQATKNVNTYIDWDEYDNSRKIPFFTLRLPINSTAPDL